MITAWGKVIEAGTKFLANAVEAGVNQYRTKYEELLKVAKEMMAELRNKNQACEAMAVAMDTKDKRITDLLTENNTLKKLLKEKEQ